MANLVAVFDLAPLAGPGDYHVLSGSVLATLVHIRSRQLVSREFSFARRFEYVEGFRLAS